MTDEEAVGILRAARESDPISSPAPSGEWTIAREAIDRGVLETVDRWVLDHGGRIDFSGAPGRPSRTPRELPVDLADRGPSYYVIPPRRLAGDG